MYHNWLNRSERTTAGAGSQYARLAFSQHGEDLVLWHMFGGPDPVPGVYVDVGCFHPHLYSNTKLLSLAGWTGSAVDANPDLAGAWTADRPRDIFENVGISDRRGLLEFFVFDDGAVNTFDRKAAEQWMARGWKLARTLQIPTEPLGGVLARHAALLRARIAAGTPTFLNVDIEGNDTAAILSTEFTADTFRPSAMCVEFWGNPLGADNPVRVHVERQGYALVAVTGPSMIFRRVD